MTTDVIIPFPEDLVYNDLVENNLPPSDVPSVSPTPSSRNDSDENDVVNNINTNDNTWMTTSTKGKEFRSSFLFQSSCYLPDDDGTESETSYSHHTSPTTLQTTTEYPKSLLHRDEIYTQQQPLSLLPESLNATSINSILKLATPLSADPASPQRRVMFYDSDDGEDNNNILNLNHVNSGSMNGAHPSRNHGDDEEKSSSWATGGFNRILVPLHHKFHSLPSIRAVKSSATINDTTTAYENSHLPQQWLQQEPQNQLWQYGDDEDPGTVASQLQYSNNLVQQRKRRRQMCCLFSILILVVVSISAAIMCGSTGCGRNTTTKEEGSSFQSPPNNVSSPTINLNESMAPSMTPSQPRKQQRPSPFPSKKMAPTKAPTMVNQIQLTLPPSISPTVIRDKIDIYSTEQLYRAVDAYLLYSYNRTILDADDNDYSNVTIGLWDVSRLTNFSSVFSMLRNPLIQYHFNADLRLWDTSNAVTMEQMFYGAEKWVEGNIALWRTSNVTNMREMFARASLFNEDLSRWDVSRVITMEGMFRNTNNFKGNLRYWNTSSVRSMSKMFLNCGAFSGFGVDAWDTSRVIDMKDMFRYTPTFNGDVSSWNVSQVTTMRGMFRQAVAFNSDLSRWDLRSVTDISQMFMHAVRFNADISSWNTSLVTNTSEAFFGAISFNGDISAWDVSKVLDLAKMFAGAINFKQDLCPWITRLPPSDKVKTITRSIFLATNCPVTIRSVLTAGYGNSFCYECDNATPSNSTAVPIMSHGNIFDVDVYEPLLTHEELLIAVDEYIDDMTNSSNVARKYGHPISRWNVSLVTNFSMVFDTHRNPKLIKFVEDLDGWNTSSATSMSRMFAGASWFNGNISTWSTSRVTTMEGMFHDAFTFNGDLSRWDTSSCTTMASMFAGADQFNGNLTSFDTSNVVDMSQMFCSALSFTGIGLSSWNTSSVTSMRSMFEQTFSFTADVLSSWDVSRVVEMTSMFQQSSFNGNISNWNVSNVEFFHYMFGGAGAFNQDLSPWNVTNGINFNGMFSGAKGFNQNLCNWGPRIDATPITRNVYVAGMFLSSACTNTSDPNIGRKIRVESMCRDCNN